MDSTEYGPDYRTHLLEQYKLYVEMADRISQRRDQSNRFYAGLMSAVIALLVVMARFGVSGIDWTIALFVAGVFGAALSVVWYVNLGSYRALNAAKYHVINNGLEPQLPYAGYSEELEQLRRAKYSQLTRIEGFVPLLVLLLFIGIAAYALYSLACLR